MGRLHFMQINNQLWKHFVFLPLFALYGRAKGLRILKYAHPFSTVCFDISFRRRSIGIIFAVCQHTTFHRDFTFVLIGMGRFAPSFECWRAFFFISSASAVIWLQIISLSLFFHVFTFNFNIINGSTLGVLFLSVVVVIAACFTVFLLLEIRQIHNPLSYALSKPCTDLFTCITI